MEAHTGPLPPPKQLAEYQAIIPDAPERFMAAMEQEGTHRRSIETYVTHWNVRLSLLGMALGFIIAMTGLGISGYIIVAGRDLAHTIAGSVLGGGGLVALVTVFIYGNRSARQERTEKTEILARIQEQINRR